MADGNMSEKIRALKEQMWAYKNRKAHENKTVSHDQWIDETEPKRGRGRPRKEVDPNAPPKIKRGRGRPRKIVDTTNIQPKRGRGRPRKPVDPYAAAMPKRGRGRPRKEIDPNAPPKIKRGRGRPRKYPAEQSLYQQDVQQTPVETMVSAPLFASPEHKQQAVYQQQPVQSQPVVKEPVSSEEVDDAIDDDVEDVDFDEILRQLDALSTETEEDDDTAEDVENTEEKNASEDIENVKDEDVAEDVEEAESSVDESEPIADENEALLQTDEPVEDAVLDEPNLDSDESTVAKTEMEEPVYMSEPEMMPEPQVEEQDTQPDMIEDEDLQPSAMKESETNPEFMHDDADMQPSIVTEQSPENVEDVQPTVVEDDSLQVAAEEDIQPSMVENNAEIEQIPEQNEENFETEPSFESQPAAEFDSGIGLESSENQSETNYISNVWDENGDVPYFEWFESKQKQLTPIGYKKVGSGEQVDDSEVINAVVKKVFRKNADTQGAKILVPVAFAIAGVAGGYFLSNGLLGGDFLWYCIGGGAAGGAIISSAITCAFGSGSNCMLKSPEILRWKINDLNKKAREVLVVYDKLKDSNLRKAKSFVKKNFAVLEESAFGIYKSVKAVLREIDKNPESNFYDSNAKNYSKFIKKYRISVAKIAKKLKYEKQNESLEHIKTVYSEILDDTQCFGSFLEVTRLKNNIKTNNFFENVRVAAPKEPKKVVENVVNETKLAEPVIPQLPEKEYNILKERIPYYIDQCTDKHGRINAKQVFEDADRVFGADVNLKARFLMRAFNKSTFVVNDDNVFRLAKDVLLCPEFADLVGSDLVANDFNEGVKKLSDAINSSPAVSVQLMKYQENLDPVYQEIFKKNYTAVMQVIGEIEEEKEEEKEQQSFADEILEDRKREDNELFLSWEKQYLETLDPESKAVYEGMDFAEKQELKKNVLAAIHKEMGDEIEEEDNIDDSEPLQSTNNDDDNDEGEGGVGRLPQLDEEGNFIEQPEESFDDVIPSLNSEGESNSVQGEYSNDNQFGLMDDVQPSIENNVTFDNGNELQTPTNNTLDVETDKQAGEQNDQNKTESISSSISDSLDELPSLPQVDENGNLIE